MEMDFSLSLRLRITMDDKIEMNLKDVKSIKRDNIFMEHNFDVYQDLHQILRGLLVMKEKDNLLMMLISKKWGSNDVSGGFGNGKIFSDQ